MTEIHRPGFYKCKLVKGGPWVPVRLAMSIAKDPITGEQLDRSPRLVGWIGGMELPAIVGGRERDIEDLWSWLHEIDEVEHAYLLRAGAWAQEHAPHLPEANPLEPIDLNELEPLF